MDEQEQQREDEFRLPQKRFHYKFLNWSIAEFFLGLEVGLNRDLDVFQSFLLLSYLETSTQAARDTKLSIPPLFS